MPDEGLNESRVGCERVIGCPGNHSLHSDVVGIAGHSLLGFEIFDHRIEVRVVERFKKRLWAGVRKAFRTLRGFIAGADILPLEGALPVENHVAEMDVRPNVTTPPIGRLFS